MREDKITDKYQEYISKKVLFLLVSVVFLIICLLISISIGSSSITIHDVLYAFLRKGEEWKVQIIWQIRIPRVLSAILAGLGLSIAGVAMQSILRNPLGSPYTLGVSQAAAFGAASAVIVLGAGSTQSSSADSVILNNPYLITISAFFWALVSTAGILSLSKLRNATPETLVLAGIAIGSLFTAGMTSLQYFASDIELAAVIFWTFGDLGKSTWRDFGIMVVVLIPILIYFIWNSWNYNALDSGDETAKSLGVDVEKTRMHGMLLSSLAAAVIVSFFGIIGFVGLVVPHIVRKVIGGDERYLIPASAIFGAAFLLASDTVARTIIAPIILPVGILTSFLGAPLFIYLLVKGRSYW
ncbi:MAG: iron ABC transporter permease [Candidatus Thermoplasmatota archaeon]|nr:iron ABC transporter permease [Candidatus Thermoplasmatota archaeon]MBS3789409.1 iron ABC transporter permease [Candidatus Thermoplasmatota archaeon]